MIEKIRKEIIKVLNDENLQIEELKRPSKNLVFVVISKDKKYLLKVYKFQEDKENIKSFMRERKAIDYFSSHLDEVEPLIASDIGDNPWILMNYFERPSLKKTEDFKLYKKTISLMIKLHSLKNYIKKPTETEVLEFYDKKLQEVKERVKKYLPKKYDGDFLITLVDNFYLCYKYIFDHSNNLIQGDFVDRNILINKKLNLIDFENSRVAPLVEDLIFFIENSKLDNFQKEELIRKYKSEIEFDEKIFLILTILTKLRILGSLLKIKKDKLEKFGNRITSSIKEIKSLTLDLKDSYNLDLIKKEKDDWEEIFSSKGTFFNEVHNDLSSFTDSLNKNAKVLDLGSGSGRHTIFLTDNGFDVTGIDSAKKGIEITKKILGEKKLNAKLIYKDFYEGLPFENNSFDCIISTQVIHHNRLCDIKKLIGEMRRVLKPEGKIFITVPKMKDISHKQPLEIEKNTFIPTKGHEQGVVHHYFDIPEIKEMFSNFEFEIKEDNYKHYLIKTSQKLLDKRDKYNIS